jgi:isopentenyl-diphosphate Delta-isomerase
MNDGARSHPGAGSPPERVVLLDEDHRPIGTEDKSTVHTADTPLHLAFSCHVFDPQGRVLVTRRALAKATWPGVWTNAFCGHPGPGESLEDAVRRRARWELGIAVESLAVALPDFRYRATDASGLVENEYCPVFTAVTRDVPQPRADEVGEYQWAEPAALEAAVASAPWAFSPWLVLQLQEFRLAGRP